MARVTIKIMKILLVHVLGQLITYFCQSLSNAIALADTEETLDSELFLMQVSSTTKSQVGALFH